MKKFIPKRAYFENESLDYSLGKKIYNKLKKKDIPITFIKSHNRLPDEGRNMPPHRAFKWAKETLVVGVKKTLTFKNCRPSADYRLVTGTSCPGKCQYCYLASTLGPAVYIRVYVNIEKLLERTGKYIQGNSSGITSFEASSSSDPVAVEHLTGTLKKLITFFADQPSGRLRVATKFSDVSKLLKISHNGHTKMRFSINTSHIIKRFEGGTSPLKERIYAAKNISDAGYPFGFIISPLIIYDSWEKDYTVLIEKLRNLLGNKHSMKEISFELIMHRFTTRARKVIEKRFPGTSLNMETDIREHKGFGKYVYQENLAQNLREHLEEKIEEYFPNSTIEYFT